MEYLRENQALVWNAYHSISHEAVSNFLKRTLRPYILQAVQKEAEGLERQPRQENMDFVADMHTLMAVGIITEWINRQEKEGGEERLEKLLTAMEGSASLMLQNLESGSSSKNDEKAV